jgi:Arc/MetJ-type ribon-helix-helix transcriptional regulator
MKTISLQIANTFDRQIRIQAAQLDMSRSDFIRAALEEKLARSATSGEAETAEKEARPVANVSEASAVCLSR